MHLMNCFPTINTIFSESKLAASVESFLGFVLKFTTPTGNFILVIHCRGFHWKWTDMKIKKTR